MTGLLNDLTREVTMLAAARGFTVAVRLYKGSDGNSVELRAWRGTGGGLSEYSRQLSLSELEVRLPEEVASEFVREARLAFSAASSNPVTHRGRVRSVR